ncbi:hypothetical protein M378DRAFT_721260 [Amanita muscaria Koide BX008]|uniref:DUF3074 domain-containing protein n=1 Tax=Amanita muscaria (strain Koide BX008) TaxID=946122 RepID=A0A0C2T2F5_AMAMK|nr:hypothetical protein M378DRAFT_721260 [Amanita muscaria Koide BX008]
MTTAAPLLTITPLKYPDIPLEESIISEGRKLIESMSSWNPGKTYHKKVRVYHKPKQPGDVAPWCGRISEHTSNEATFDQFWDKLGRNKPINEQQYIPDIRKVAKVKALSETTEIWTLYYKFPPPVSPRVFTVVQVTYLNTQAPRSGLIVSIPVDLSGDSDLAKLEEKGVRGRYVSVECLTELEDGKTEWKMATSSTPGGSIPAFIAESTVPGAIASDVPHFLKWFHSLQK